MITIAESLSNGIRDVVFDSDISVDSLIIDRQYEFTGKAQFLTQKTKHLLIGKNVSSFEGSVCKLDNYRPEIVTIEDADSTLTILKNGITGYSMGNLYLGRNVEFSENVKYKGFECKTISIGHKVTRLPLLQNSTFKAIEIPSSVTEMAQGCFKNCTNLESIIIPENVEILESETLSGCTSLKKVEIGQGVLHLGEKLLLYTKPDVLICRSEQPAECEDNTFTNAVYLNTTLVVPKESVELYSTTSPWSNFFTIQYASPISKIAFDHKTDSLSLYQVKTLDVQFIAEDQDAFPNVDFDLNWSSSNPKIVEVDQNGNIKALAIGQSIIKVCSSKDAALCDSISIKVLKLPLTITANNASRNYKDENPQFSLSYSGFVNGDNESVLIKEPKITCDATIDSDCGDYQIVVSGAEAENYDISYKFGTLTIKPLVVGFSKQYNTVTYNDMSQSQSDIWFDYIPEISGSYNEGDIAVTTYVKDENGKFDGMNPVFSHASSQSIYSGNYFGASGCSDVGVYIYDLALTGNNPNIIIGEKRAFATIKKAEHNFKCYEPNTITIAQGETKKLDLTYGADPYTDITVSTNNAKVPVVKFDIKDIRSNISEWYLTGLVDGGDCSISIQFKNYPNTWGNYNFGNYTSKTYQIRVRGFADIENIDASHITEIGRYDLTGRSVSEDYHGIVIVHYSDGSTAKIIQR